MSNTFAVDVGGTFTDLFLFNGETGSWHVEKTPTTPDDFTKGVLECIESAGVVLSDVERAALHGSTVADNAIIQRKLPSTGLITTQGCRDLLEMGRWWRGSLYNLQADKPQQAHPIIPREYRLTVEERISAQGHIVRPLDEEATRRAIRHLREGGVQSIAVCLINSYANPVHEERLAKLVEEEHPEAYVSVSSRVLPKARELARLTTTVINACLQPIMDNYLTRLEDGLRHRGFTGETLIMQSNSGVSPIDSAKARPAYMATSGPAAGVAGASHLGELIGRRRVLTFDMGGTTAKASLIRESGSEITYDFAFEWDTPIAVPMIHMSEVGAGGGSIAWVDTGGMLRVGPHSAGAVPGPVCYGRGGTEPTITDANLVLNRLERSMFAGGGMQLDIGAAKAAFDRLGAQLGLSREDTAKGVLELAETMMGEALRAVSLNKGHDPRDFALLAFGGAGPSHGVGLARKLGIKEVVVPVSPGVFSAYGMCNTDIVYDFVQSLYLPLEKSNASHLRNEVAKLEASCQERVQRDGLDLGSVQLRRFASLKYGPQAHELEVDLDVPITENAVAAAGEKFHQKHATQHGFAVREEPVVVTDVRVEVTNPVPRVTFPTMPPALDDVTNHMVGSTNAFFDASSAVECPIYRRESLCNGHSLSGPAVITESTSTTVVPPDTDVTVDHFGNLVLQIR